MKKIVMVLMFVIIFSFSVLAEATLYNRGGGLIYCDALDITWLQNANYGAGSIYDDGTSTTDGKMTWHNAMEWAENLVYGGYEDWRLPTTVDAPLVTGHEGDPDNDGLYDYTFGYNLANSEMGHLFFTELGNKALVATDGTNPQPGWGLTETGDFLNLQSYYYWCDTACTLVPGKAWRFGFNSGGLYVNPYHYNFYAWAVHSGDIGAAPDLDGVVAYYPFEGNAVDASGNGNDGTVYGATLATDRFGNSNSAYLFDGVDDCIEVSNANGNFDIDGAFTLSAWVKPFNEGSGGPSSGPIVWKISKVGLNEDNYALGWGSNSTFEVKTERASDGADFITFSDSQPPNYWYHVVGMYDQQDLSIYVNGVLENSNTIGKITPYTGDASLRIGNILNSNHGNAGVFDGIIDEVLIYDRALTENEISQLYNTPNPVNDADEDGVGDEDDNCVEDPNPDQIDSDNDGIGDVCDNCYDVYNPEQLDTDENGIGDACEDLYECRSNLDTCQNEKIDCENGLENYISLLGGCEDSLATCGNDFEVCEEEKKSYLDDLGVCEGNLDTCSEDLIECEADLNSCLKIATPGTNYTIDRFRIKSSKRGKKNKLEIKGSLDLPSLSLGKGDTTEVILTIEVKGALINNDDLVLIEKFPVTVKKNSLIINIKK